MEWCAAVAGGLHDLTLLSSLATAQAGISIEVLKLVSYGTSIDLFRYQAQSEFMLGNYGPSSLTSTDGRISMFYRSCGLKLGCKP